MTTARRIVLALLAGILSSGAVFAMAASLGGVTTVGVGADNTVITSCDPDGISTSYQTSWDTTDGRYEITQVTVSGVHNNCDGQTLNVSLTTSANVQSGTGSLAIPTSTATSFNVPLSTAAATRDAANVHVLIAS